MPQTAVPAGAHEWVSFPDPDEDRTWVFDVTFLESSWTCIFGQGCQGVLTGPAPEMVQGCCSYGAHFTGKKDVRRVAEAAATLTRDQWQHHDAGWAKASRARSKAGGDPVPRIVMRDDNGALVTRQVDDACIFLNRPGFAGGAGCALHRAAVERKVPHLQLKPDVCWQLPLRREDAPDEEGHVTSTIQQWDRRHWGAGGYDFHWWCTESPEAFVGRSPVYKRLRDELIEMVGTPVYERLARYLKARAVKGNGSGEPRPVKVPHPAVRRR